MSSFKMDEEATLDHMAFASNVDLFNGWATLYAAVCVGSEEHPNSSHGGQVGNTAQEAIKAAHEANEASDTCHYLALAIGIDPMQVFDIANKLVDSGQEHGPDAE